MLFGFADCSSDTANAVNRTGVRKCSFLHFLLSRCTTKMACKILYEVGSKTLVGNDVSVYNPPQHALDQPCPRKKTLARNNDKRIETSGTYLAGTIQAVDLAFLKGCSWSPPLLRFEGCEESSFVFRRM